MSTTFPFSSPLAGIWQTWLFKCHGECLGNCISQFPQNPSSQIKAHWFPMHFTRSHSPMHIGLKFFRWSWIWSLLTVEETLLLPVPILLSIHLKGVRREVAVEDWVINVQFLRHLIYCYQISSIVCKGCTTLTFSINIPIEDLLILLCAPCWFQFQVHLALSHPIHNQTLPLYNLQVTSCSFKCWYTCFFLVLSDL